MKLTKSILSIALLWTSACTVSAGGGSDTSPDAPPPASQWKAYSADPLAGSVFGNSWTAKTAVLLPATSGSSTRTLQIFGEVLPNACSGNMMGSVPWASLSLPKDFSVKEYVADLSGAGTLKNPLVFSSLVTDATNLLADKTKISIQSISSEGLSALIFAEGTDENRRISSINGKIDVIDCAHNLDFATWQTLVGSYSLESFDGQIQNGETTDVSLDPSSFNLPNSEAYIRAVTFPLIMTVSDGTYNHYTFGPLEGLGFGSAGVENDTTTFHYKFDGPLVSRGYPIELSLDLTVVVKGSSMNLDYTVKTSNTETPVHHTANFRKW